MGTGHARPLKTELSLYTDNNNQRLIDGRG